MSAVENSSLIDRLLIYANSNYTQPYEQCTNNSHISPSQCETCLKNTHYKELESGTYTCPNICSVYICKYTHKYASEIYKALVSLNLDQEQKVNVLSLGCGPATELIALDEYFREFEFTGVDLNNNWSNIHKFYSENINEAKTVNFDIINACDYIENNDIAQFDIIIMNYFLSDMVAQQKNKTTAKAFLELLNSKIIEIDNPPSIIFNDINLNFPDRGALDIMLSTVSQNENYTTQIRQAYKNEKKNEIDTFTYTFSGELNIISDNSLHFRLIQPYVFNYNPYRTISAAQILLKAGS